jgi:hypothetical protein
MARRVLIMGAGLGYRFAVIVTAAAVSLLLLGALAVFQALLVAGQPLGRFAWGGQHEVLPARLRTSSAVSIGLYAVFAVLILQAAGTLSILPDGVGGVAIWVLAAYFVLGIGMNAVSRSRPERLVMTPVVAVLAAACLVLAVH